jgi:hypothetical protein
LAVAVCAVLLLGKEPGLVFVDRRVALSKPPLRDESEIAPLGFLDQIGTLGDQPIEVIRDAGIDLFFLTHGNIKVERGCGMHLFFSYGNVAIRFGEIEQIVSTNEIT